MRLKHTDGTTIHTGYCGNVHQAEDLGGGVAQLVADDGRLKRLKNELADREPQTVALNTFPRAGRRTTRGGAAPRWPPLARREPRPADRADADRRTLDRLAERLAGIEADTGRTIRVGSEPERGCVVEPTAQAADGLGGLDPDRLGVCLDACRLAVRFEGPAEAVARLAAVGLPVVELQASSAIEPADLADPAAHAALRRLVEPRFQHRTRTVRADAVLAGKLPTDTGAWRVHFHAPCTPTPSPRCAPHPVNSPPCSPSCSHDRQCCATTSRSRRTPGPIYLPHPPTSPAESPPDSPGPTSS